MKIRFIAILPFLVLSLSSFAQSEQGKFSFGVRAGINFQNINGKDASGATLKNGILVKYNLGINVEIPIVPDFYFQPNLLFSTKGAKIKNSGNDYNLNLSYLELPLNFLYKPLLGTGHLLLGFGPYLAYAVGGNVSGNGTTQKITFKGTNDGSVAGPIIKPFDTGANLLFGYEFANKLSFQLNAQLGLVKINPSYSNAGNNHEVLKNTGFGISAGYRF